MSKQLVEKYRPSTIEGYVFKDEHLKGKVQSYIQKHKNNNGEIPFPNLLLGGRAGTGKTTLAYILCNECGVDKVDIMYINASRESNIETVRTKINGFCSSMAMGDYKVIILDEFDRMSQAGQDALKSMFEVYGSAVRFIATANSPNKIIPPLHSRFQVFNFDALDEGVFLERLISIVESENIFYDIEDLDKIVTKSFPDLRKAINLIDQFTIDGKLVEFVSQDVEINDELFRDIVSAGMSKRYTTEMRVLTSQLQSDEYLQFFQYLFNNLGDIFETSDQQGEALPIIARGMLSIPNAADQEMNVAGIMAELSRLND